MLLVDFSGIMFQSIHSAVASLKDELRVQDDGRYNVTDIIPAIKGFIISSLFSYQEMFKEYGTMVICLDSHTNNWRKEVLSTYKARRKTGRDDSPIPFDHIFQYIDELINQFITNTPWKVVKVKGAEADDIILVLAEVFSDVEEVLILSSDKDMIQAQRKSHIKQYSPLVKKWLTFNDKSNSMSGWIQEHIILGDDTDDVPRITAQTEFTQDFENYMKSINVSFTPKEYLQLTPEQVIEIEENYNVLNKKGGKDIWKNPKMGPKTLQKIINEGRLDEWLDSNELYRPNYERNKKLVLQECIPSAIFNECIIKYKEINKNNININEFKNYLYDNGLMTLAETLPPNFVSGTISIDDFL